MRIGGLGSSPFAFGIPRFRAPAGLAAEAPRPASDERAGLLRLVGLLGEMRRALSGDLPRIAATAAGGRASSIRVRSDARLGLDPTVAPAVLRSDGEVNAIPTSYTPFGPDWSGLTSAEATLDGTYDGDQGDAVLTFRVTRPGIVGLSQVRIDVFDPDGTRIDRLNLSGSYVPGTPLALSNGLTLALGGGQALLNDEFQASVSVSVPSAVDPTKPFDGTRDERPSFEPGRAVVAGSFTVNGVVIAVGASDTLLDVLARIEASDAGVTARFDAASERVVLTHGTPGAAGAIELADDTSGFFAATKLDTAALEPGRDSDLDRPIASVPALAGISSGTLRIDGIAVPLDVASDSLNAVLARIQELVPGVSARYDAVQDRVRVHGSGTLALDDGGTGFFATLRIEEGEHRPAGTRTRGFSDRAGMRGALEELARAWNELFAVELGGAAGRHAARLRGGLVEAVRTAFRERLGEDDGARLRTPSGLRFELGDGEGRLDLDERVLERTLRDDARGLALFLLGEDDVHGGLLAALERALETAAAGLGAALDFHGLGFVDLEA